MSYATEQVEPGKKEALELQNSRYEKLVRRLYGCLNASLGLLFDAMLKSSAERLTGYSGQTENDAQKAQYTGVMRLIRSDAHVLRRIFFERLKNHLQQPRSAASVTEADAGELALVEEAEMEEMVAMTTIFSQAVNLYGEQVNHLEARLEYLEINTVDLCEKDILDPRKLCDVFKQTLDAMDLGVETRLILYRLYNDEINLKLGPVYEKLNELLIEADILPKIILQTSKVDGYGEKQRAEVKTVQSAASDNRFQGHHDPERTHRVHSVDAADTRLVDNALNEALYEQTRQVVSQFLNGSRTIERDDIPDSFSRVVTENEDGKSCYDRSELLIALSNLQHLLIRKGDTPQVDEPMNTESIKRQLFRGMAKTAEDAGEKQVNVLDERSIDFVGMMFSVITDDENISKVIRNLIIRLQIPVIKIAMMDKRLFEEEHHPCKTLLDLVARAGKGIVEETDAPYGEIETIVNDVVARFDRDLAVFEEAIDALSAIVDQQVKKAREVERKERISVVTSHAKKVVLDKLKIFSSGLTLPPSIQPLVLKHWSTLMLNHYIKRGKDSFEWKQSVLLLKLLLRCLQPIDDETQFVLLKNNYQVLTDCLADELYATKQDKKSIEEQLRNLQKHFVNMINEYDEYLQRIDFQSPDEDGECGVDDEEVVYQARQRQKSINIDDDVISIDPGLCEPLLPANRFIPIAEEYANLDKEAQDARRKIEAAKALVAQLSDEVRPGNWFRVYNGELRARRLKLSVILSEVAKLVFVDHHGRKVIEKTIEDFIQELRDGRSSVIADHSTFNQALGQVIHTLAA